MTIVEEVEKNKELDHNITRNLIKFHYQYENMIGLVYERTLKEAGLIFKDANMIARQDKVISFLIKKIGSNLIKGKSIMNISLPITIFDKRTLLHVYNKFI